MDNSENPSLPDNHDIDKTVPTDFSRLSADPDRTVPTNLNAGREAETLPTIGGSRSNDTIMMGDAEQRPSANLGTPEIPGYEIVRILGEGGMGVVYEARQVAVNRTVAIKVLKPAVAAEPEFRERFLRESAAAGSVTHPNVVQIFDAGEADGHLYMTFQLIDGGDLSDLLREKGLLSEFKALQIIKECLLGLTAIHEAGLVHRDIKPGNIFMEQGRRPVIGDLGLARQTSGDDRMTMTGAAMGTPSYMSPEHIQGVADIDIRTDIYAFGSTLYKMLTGTEPFQGETVYAITHSIISQPIPDPREINASLSNPVVGIIRKAMAKNRDERYQNPEQFLQDIEAALSGHQLIHAEGLGIIEGVEKPAPAQGPAKPAAGVSLGRGKRNTPSLLRVWGKPLAALFVIGWFLLVLKWVRLDTSRYEPDWADSANSDQYGRYITLKVGSQIQQFRLVRGGERYGHVILGAEASEPGYRADEELFPTLVEDDFWIADSEVTQALWLEIMDDNPSYYVNSYFPVHNMSYEQVQVFIDRLNEIYADDLYEARFNVRLPTQIEWEHACRAGVELKSYGDQDVIQSVGHAAGGALKAEWETLWQNQDLGELDYEEQAWALVEQDPEAYGPRLIKSMQPNRWGIYDMIGNVAELSSSDWDGQSPRSEQSAGSLKVAQGGSWFDHPYRCRSGSRSGLAINEGASFVGFRLVLDIEQIKR